MTKEGVGSIEEQGKSLLPLEAILELAPTGAVLLDAAGRVTWFNQAAADFFGLKLEQAIGCEWQSLLSIRVVRPADNAGDGEGAALQVCLGEGLPERWLEQHSRTLDGGQRVVYYVDVTGHKQTEETLHGEQELLQRLFDLLPVMITVYDPAVQRLEGNRAFQELTGWSNDDLESVDIMEVAYPDPAYREEVRRFMNSLQGWLDLELTARDGTIIHSRWANMRLSDERQVGIGLDIRAQKEAEAALKAQAQELALKNQELQGLFDQAPAGLVLFEARPPFRVLAHNHVYQQMWPEPYASQSLVGLAPVEYAPQVQEEGVLDIFQQIIASGQGRVFHNFPYDGLPGGRTWWNWHLSPIFADGEVVALAQLGFEVTREVEAHVQAEAERTRLEAVLAQMPAGVMIAAAPSGRLIMGNEQVAAIWRHPYVAAADVAGYRAYRGFHADGTSYMAEEWPLARAIRTGEVIHGEEIAIQRGDGTRGTINASAAPIWNDQGEIVAGVVVFSDVTVQKETEAALRAREEEFLILANSIPQLAWMADAAGNFIWYNERWYTYTGTVFAEMQNGGWEQRHHPDHRQRVLSLFKQCLATGEPWEDTFPLRDKDGEYRWFLSRALPLLDETGQVLRWFGTHTDITKNLQLEEALVESQARFRRLLEEAPVGIVMYDQDGVFRQVNTTFTRLTGYRLEDIPQMDIWLQRAYRDRAEVMRQIIGQLPHHDEPFQEELDVWTKWDELRTYLVSSVSLERTEDRRLRMSTFIDITEQKAAQAEREGLLQALAEEREQLRELNETLEERVTERTRELVQARDHFYTLFHASPVPKAIARLEDGLLRNVNTAYERFFGTPEAELAGRAIGQGGLWPELAGRPQWLEQLRRKGGVRNAEFRVRDASGETRTVLASVTLFEMEGETHAIIAFVDISERIKAERQIRHLASELTLAEQRERRRIAQILHDDIQQMLVAHQLTLHLVGLSTDEETRRQIQEAGGFVGEIVEATRSLSGELAMPAIRSEHLRDGLTWLASHMEERYQLQVDVDVDKKCTLPELKLRELVVQLVRELLFNIVKHAAVDRAQLRATNCDDRLVLEIEDHGRGFDAEAVLGDGTIPDSFGLYSIKERLELFGGDLRVRSAPGEGTQVTIVVPKGRN